MTAIVKLLIYSITAFAYLFIIAKILGKKQIAQLDFMDYIVGISLGSIAADMAFDIDTPIWYFLVGMTIFALMDLLFSILGRKLNFFKKLFVGRPIILIQDGKLNYKNLQRSKLSINEFLAMCREKGFFDIDDIAFCLLETSGKLSVLPKSFATPTTVQDVGVSKPQASLSKDVIMDGQVVEACLTQLAKDREWLMQKLGADADNIANIALAFYDSEQDRLHIHYKTTPT